MRLSALALILVAACAGASSKPTAPAAPLRPPPELVAELDLPRVDGGLAGVHAFADAVQPGISAVLRERSLFLQLGVDLAGAAGDRPLRVYVLDPKAYERPVALLVGVGDAAELRRAAAAKQQEVKEAGGFALVGDRRVVLALERWALGQEARAAVAPAPTLRVFPGPLASIYRQEIETVRSAVGEALARDPALGRMAGFTTAYLDGMFAVFTQSERIDLAVVADARAAALEIDLVPVAGSALAGFVGAQQPSDYRLLERLPAGQPSLVIAGHVALGPVRDQVGPLFVQAMASLYGVPVTPEIEKAFDELLDAMAGEVAAAGELSLDGLRLGQLSLADAPKAMAASSLILAALGGMKEVDMGAVRMRVGYTPNAASPDGVRFDAYDAEVVSPPVGLPAALGKTHMLFAGWDDVLGMTLGAGGDPAALVAASRGKAPRLVLPPPLARLLDDSRSRKESFFYYFGVGKLLAQTLGVALQPGEQVGGVIALGFPEGRLRMRLATTLEDVLTIKRLTVE